ncbi:MAG: hypothetical protein ACK44A_13315 [Roseateles sp.]
MLLASAQLPFFVVQVQHLEPRDQREIVRPLLERHLRSQRIENIVREANVPELGTSRIQDAPHRDLIERIGARGDLQNVRLRHSLLVFPRSTRGVDSGCAPVRAPVVVIALDVDSIRRRFKVLPQDVEPH